MEHNILDDDFQEKESKPVEYVGFWPRVGAAIIDVFVILPILIIVILNLVYFKSLSIDILLAFLMMAYKPYFEYKYGGTLGKSAMKIKVVDNRFEKMDLQTSLIRNLIYIVPSLLGIFHSILLFSNPDFQAISSFDDYAMLEDGQDPIGRALGFLTLISAIVVIFSDRKQAGHDIVAKTYCIYK